MALSAWDSLKNRMNHRFIWHASPTCMNRNTSPQKSFKPLALKSENPLRATRRFTKWSPGHKTRGVPSDGLRHYGLSILKTREIRDPNAFKARLKCICHEIALSATRQTCTWNCPENPGKTRASRKSIFGGVLLQRPIF